MMHFSYSESSQMAKELDLEIDDFYIQGSLCFANLLARKLKQPFEEATDSHERFSETNLELIQAIRGNLKDREKFQKDIRECRYLLGVFESFQRTYYQTRHDFAVEAKDIVSAFDTKGVFDECSTQAQNLADGRRWVNGHGHLLFSRCCRHRGH